MSFINGANMVYIGCAGWNIPARSTARFPPLGTHLERYAQHFSAVEINSSFYRPHRRETYVRWAASVSADFRFSVKIPKLITHELGLRKAAAALDEFLESALGLGDRLGCLLVQLPPSLAFEKRIADAFFTRLRKSFPGAAVCEPRHPSWFAPKVTSMLEAYDIGRVAADPPPVPEAAHPAGSSRIHYYRLHGSPDMYYSCYSQQFLAELALNARQLAQASTELWFIFDNTAAGWATENAWQLQTLI
jgi:uncharacterized protein YecE (DUF72 family)